MEKTNPQGEYWAGNAWRQPEHDREYIHVRFGKDVVLDVETTDHGPVITPLFPHETRMLALKWTLYKTQLAACRCRRWTRPATGQNSARH